MDDCLAHRSYSMFSSVNEFGEVQREECGDCAENFQGRIAAHFGLSNVADIIAKTIGKFLLRQLLGAPEFREFGSNRLCQCPILSFLIGTDGFGHSPYSFA